MATKKKTNIPPDVVIGDIPPPKPDGEYLSPKNIMALADAGTRVAQQHIRRYFAAAAMNGLLAAKTYGEDHAVIVNNAVLLADALIEQLDKPKT